MTAVRAPPPAASKRSTVIGTEPLVKESGALRAGAACPAMGNSAAARPRERRLSVKAEVLAHGCGLRGARGLGNASAARTGLRDGGHGNDRFLRERPTGERMWARDPCVARLGR